MKKTELNMAVTILKKIQKDYTGMFDHTGKVIPNFQDYMRDTKRTPTATAEELRYVRRLLLEVQKELG